MFYEGFYGFSEERKKFLSSLDKDGRSLEYTIKNRIKNNFDIETNLIHFSKTIEGNNLLYLGPSGTITNKKNDYLIGVYLNKIDNQYHRIRMF